MAKLFAMMTGLLVVCCLAFAAADTRTRADEGKEKPSGKPDPATTITKVYKDAKLTPPTAKDAAFYTGSVTSVIADSNSYFVFVVHPTTPGSDTTFVIKPTTAGGEDMKKVVLAAYTAGQFVSVYSADAAIPLSASIFR